MIIRTSATRLALPIFLCFSLGIHGMSQAQEAESDIDEEAKYAPFKRDSDSVLVSFASIVKEVSEQSTVSVLVDGEVVALGVVVHEDGYIMTKSSEVRIEVPAQDAAEVPAEVTLQFHNKEVFSAGVVGRDLNFDLVLLKIDSNGLKPIEWREDQDIQQGRIVLSVGADSQPLSLGTVGVFERKISGGKGRLGFRLSQGENVKDVIIGSISKATPASQAGLLEGDVILAIDEEPIENLIDTMAKIRKKLAGDEIRLSVRRENKTLELVTTLAARASRSTGSGRRSLEGERSRLRGGFPAAFQHDSVVTPHACGGVVVGIDGKAFGLNIARAGRTVTYAIPGSEVMEVFEALRTSN